MKNLNYLGCIEIDEYDAIVAGKHTANKLQLQALRPQVLAEYKGYLGNFNNVVNIPASTFNNSDAKLLRDCYQIPTKVRDRLLARILESQTVQFKHVCPYCLINKHSTFDHYIPEQAFPVFSVLVNNLIPCCGTCNGKKLQYWRDGGKRAIIHFYREALTDTPYLFGSLSFSVTGVPSVQYTLSNPNGIPSSTFDIIENHYRRLNLLERYSSSLDLPISTIKDDVDDLRSEFGALVDNGAISRVITRKSNKLKEHFGHNNWQSVAFDLLSNSNQFLSSL